MNHGKQSPQVSQEYSVSVVLCKLLYRLVGKFGMTGSAEEEGAKKKTQKEKNHVFTKEKLNNTGACPKKLLYLLALQMK